MIVGIEVLLAEAITLGTVATFLGATAATAGAARGIAQGLPRTSRERLQQQKDAKAKKAREAGQGARQKVQSRLAASSTDPATAPTGRGVLGSGSPAAGTPPTPTQASAGRGTAITPSTAQPSSSPVLSSGGPTAAPSRPALVASRLTRPASAGGVPPSATGPGGGSGLSLESLLAAQVVGSAGAQVKAAFDKPPGEAESIILRDPDALQREKDRRRADRQRGGRRGTALSPNVGSASELMSERATLLGR